MQLRISTCALRPAPKRPCIFCLLGGWLTCCIWSANILRPPCWSSHIETLPLTVPAELSLPVILANMPGIWVKTLSWKQSLFSPMCSSWQLAAGSCHWNHPSHSGLPNWSHKHHRAGWIISNPTVCCWNPWPSDNLSAISWLLFYATRFEVMR